MLGTFFLVFAYFGTAVDPKAPRIGGLGIGLTLTAVVARWRRSPARP
jgi:hypothetical protein